MRQNNDNSQKSNCRHKRSGYLTEDAMQMAQTLKQLDKWLRLLQDMPPESYFRARVLHEKLNQLIKHMLPTSLWYTCFQFCVFQDI